MARHGLPCAGHKDSDDFRDSCQHWCKHKNGDREISAQMAMLMQASAGAVQASP